MPTRAAPQGPRLRVAVDATPLLGSPTGVGRFCRGALGALGARSDVEVRAFAVTWRRRHQLGRLVPSGVEVRQRAMPARPLHLAWSHLRGPALEWFVGRADVVHGTNFVVPPARHMARVVTVHDLTPLRFPQMAEPATLAFPDLVRRSVAAGAWVHTPSQFVADEVVADLGVPPERVRAVPGGVGAFGHAPAAPEVAPGVPTPALPGGTTRYVFAVGTVEPRKDYVGLLHAFARMASAHPDVALVVAGPDGWGADAFTAAVDACPQRRRVLRLGYVDDAELARWLAGAAVLAFPSVYEGFGFPPLEAMAAGVPVVATAAGAVPEVVGDAAVLAAPGDPDAFAGALASVLDDPEQRDALVQRGRRRVARFTWEACADGLTRLYADAVDAAGAGTARTAAPSRTGLRR